MPTPSLTICLAIKQSIQRDAHRTSTSLSVVELSGNYQLIPAVLREAQQEE